MELQSRTGWIIPLGLLSVCFLPYFFLLQLNLIYMKRIFHLVSVKNIIFFLSVYLDMTRFQSILLYQLKPCCMNQRESTKHIDNFETMRLTHAQPDQFVFQSKLVDNLWRLLLSDTAELWTRAPIHLTQCRSYNNLLIGQPILVFCNLTDLIW